MSLLIRHETQKYLVFFKIVIFRRFSGCALRHLLTFGSSKKGVKNIYFKISLSPPVFLDNRKNWKNRFFLFLGSELEYSIRKGVNWAKNLDNGKGSGETTQLTF